MTILRVLAVFAAAQLVVVFFAVALGDSASHADDVTARWRKD